MITNEEWKPIKDYENLYKVSNYGRIKARRKVIYGMVDGEEEPLFVRPEQILTPFDNGSGYLKINLSKDGNIKSFFVHRLVAEAFLDNPENKPQINHKDFDRHNNRISNLEWTTGSENIRYSLPNQPKRKKYKTNSGYRYVYKRGNRYRVTVVISKTQRVDRAFDTLNDAINYRNHIFEELGESIDE
jgi:hypothetical protein